MQILSPAVLDATEVPVRRPAPVDSIARTAGIGLLETRATLKRLDVAGFVEQRSGGWVLRDAEGADSAAESPEVPTIDP